MTYAPETLRAARSLLLNHLDIHPTGSYPADLDPAEVGIVGDTAHATKGTSYHLGADQLTATAYSRRTARDRAGLSNAASAVDVGEFRITTSKGTFTQRDLAIWSVEQCQSNHPDTRDFREIIYSPDGKVVLRYDRERGYASEPETGEADNSHLTHNHYSQYRDAEFRYTMRDHFARWLTHIGAIGDDMPYTEQQMQAFTWQYKGRGIGENNGTTIQKSTLAYFDEVLLTVRAIAGKVDIDPAELAAIQAAAEAGAKEALAESADAFVAAIVGGVMAELDPENLSMEAVEDAAERAVRSVLGGLDGATPAAG